MNSFDGPSYAAEWNGNIESPTILGKLSQEVQMTRNVFSKDPKNPPREELLKVEFSVTNGVVKFFEDTTGRVAKGQKLELLEIE
jgi:hypothetical protein